jgi:hypothetical protein
MFASTAAQLVLLLAAVTRQIPVRWSNVFPSLAKVLAATGVTALAARALVQYLPVTRGTLASKALALGGGAVLVVTYLVTAWVLRCDEMNALRSRLRRQSRDNR